MQESKDVWFVLYSGSSVDGMGKGTFFKRTTSYDEAKSHYDQNHKDPFSVASVKAYTDKGEYYIHCRDDWKRWEFRITINGDSISPKR